MSGEVVTFTVGIRRDVNADVVVQKLVDSAVGTTRLVDQPLAVQKTVQATVRV